MGIGVTYFGYYGDKIRAKIYKEWWTLNMTYIIKTLHYHYCQYNISVRNEK
jgi:hypothetical protein